MCYIPIVHEHSVLNQERKAQILMITIKEIAQLAGTSRGTVDRVLNGRGNVNAELTQKILAIAQEHNYQSNPYAKALVSGKKRYRIGVVISSKGNRFFDEVLLGIHDAATQSRGYGLEIVLKELKGWDEQVQLTALDELLQEPLDALAITPVDTPLVYERLKALKPLPIVTLNTDIHGLDSKLAFIGCDYINSGRLCGDVAMLALPQGGSVGIVTGSFHILGHNQRIMGFREAVATNPNIRVLEVAENKDDNDLSYQVTKTLLTTHHPDLLYFCAAGTEGGMRAVTEADYGCKVVVVDDVEPMREYLAQGALLAIVTQQPYRQGFMMVDLLYDFLVTAKRPEHVHNYMENQVRLQHSK